MSSILITGGAGFIGVNSAKYFASRGWDVVIVDNLSRRGTEENLRWLQSQAAIRFERADIRDADAILNVVVNRSLRQKLSFGACTLIAEHYAYEQVERELT